MAPVGAQRPLPRAAEQLSAPQREPAGAAWERQAQPLAQLKLEQEAPAPQEQLGARLAQPEPQLA